MQASFSNQVLGIIVCRIERIAEKNGADDTNHRKNDDGDIPPAKAQVHQPKEKQLAQLQYQCYTKMTPYDQRDETQFGSIWLIIPNKHDFCMQNIQLVAHSHEQL